MPDTLHVTAAAVDCDWRRRYDVRLVPGLLDSSGLVGDVLGNRKALLITTPTVHQLYGERLSRVLGSDIPTFVLDCNEQTKDISSVERVCVAAQAANIDRKGVLVSFGGGICSDTVTVAASWIRRGITHVRIPTTLIGQVDAGIGIKGAVNFNRKKSYLGSFHPPESVLIDSSFLATLPRHLLEQGLAEIVKIAVVRDRELFEEVERWRGELLASSFQTPADVARRVIWVAVERMLSELTTNIFENLTYRRAVDFGHTFSPVIEAATGFELSHGEAVAIDIAFSTTLGMLLGTVTRAERDRVIHLLQAARLPTKHSRLTAASCERAMDEAVRHRGGELNLVVPLSIGDCSFMARRQCTASLIDEALKSLDNA